MATLWKSPAILETIWTLYKDNKEREGVENFCHIICLPLGRKVSQYFCKNNSDTIGEKGQKISGRDLFWTISRLPEDKLEMVCNIFNFVLKQKIQILLRRNHIMIKWTNQRNPDCNDTLPRGGMYFPSHLDSRQCIDTLFSREVLEIRPHMDGSIDNIS